MSGRAAQDEDAIRRIQLEADIATRRQLQQDRHRASKGPGNIEFAPQTIMRVRHFNHLATAIQCNYLLTQ